MSSGFLAACCALALAAQPPTAAQPPRVVRPRTTTATKVAEAIGQLASRDFATREQAGESLFQLGEEARAEVEQATRSLNPEVAARAGAIVARWNAAGKTVPAPVPPPATAASPLGQSAADLAAEFRRASDRNKIGLIAKLRKPEEFRAVRELISAEPSRSLQQSQESFLVNRLVQTAGQHNGAGAIDDAVRLLEVDLNAPSVQAAYLVLMVTGNRTAAEIDKLQSQLSAEPSAANWRRLALVQRAAGDLKGAVASAQEAGDQELTRWIAAEAGDWKGALAAHDASLAGKEPDIRHLAMALVLASYSEGDGSLAARSEAVLTHVRRMPQDAGVAIEGLLIAERQSEALALMKQITPGAAFEMLWKRGDYDAAFEIAGGAHSEDYHALWLQTLPQANGGAQFQMLRHDFGQRVALALDDQGRIADADNVLTLIREAVTKRMASSSSLLDVAEAEIRRGRREQGLADAAAALDEDSRAPRPPPPPNRPNYVYSSGYPSMVLLRLFNAPDSLIRHVWPRLSASHRHDEAAALADLEKLFYGPERRKLAPLERRRLFDELHSALPADRSESQTFLLELARLADWHGDEELAYRYREQGLALYGSSGEFVTGMRGRQAFDRQDWQLAYKSWRPKEGSANSSPSYRSQWAALHFVLDRDDEGRALLDQLTASTLSATAHVTVAQALVKAEKKSKAEDAFRTALAVSVPGERNYFQLAEEWGNAASGPSPDTAARMWRIALLESMLKPPGRKLEIVLEAMPRIHIAAARAALARGDLQSAAREAEVAQRLVPASIHPALMLVPPLHNAGQRELADEVFERSFNIHEELSRQYAGSVHHRVLAARLAARCKRRLDEAAVLIDAAVELAPTRPAVHLTRAEVLLARGDRVGAKAAAGEALRLEPGSSEAQKLLDEARLSEP